ncbi:MAG TPA: AAA family ATPase [Blastocatellia bacterium]|nr:AAA family ATPase [Blastocatellia bacterium]
MLRLEKLEILGFKSFPDRTSLIFGEGITAVVGPNGCGKSNIADAISWVLGEQSPKNLRGGKMEDVIFNGTRDRKPVGMSEVMLTLVATADITARDDENPEHADDARYDEAIANAERAADAARTLVDENTRPDETEEQTQSQTASQAGADDTPVAAVDAVGAGDTTVQASQAGQSTEPASESGDPAVLNTEGERQQAEATDDQAGGEGHITHRRRTPHYRKRKAIVISAGERITVGRRLYRTGDSEYLMNGRPCLLRDVQDLFAGTGLGGAHYAIIEQGRIGQILSSKPLDRRALIEEAAGITRFKARKRAAELKLESARLNLTRLNDIISEVERQVNSLKRQAAKSRRFRRLRDEMRGLQKFVFASDYQRLNEAAARIAVDLEEAGVEQQRLDSMLAERESEHRVASVESRSLQDELTQLRERAAAADLELDRLRNRRVFEAQQLGELADRIKDLDRDSSHLSERLEFMEAERDRRGAELGSLETEVASMQVELIDREATYQTALSKLHDIETSIEEVRQRLLTETGKTERLRNLSANLLETLQRLESRQSALAAELERAILHRDDAEQQRGKARDQIEANRSILLEVSDQLRSHTESLENARAQAGGLRGRLDKLQADRAVSEHRLASLEDLDSHHAYYSDAVQHVLSPEQAAKINALGTLADFVEVEPQYERLIESLFARELQCILVPTIDDALMGVQYLKTQGLGRGAFLVVGLHGGEDDPGPFFDSDSNDQREQREKTPADRVKEDAGASSHDSDLALSEGPAQASQFNALAGSEHLIDQDQFDEQVVWRHDCGEDEGSLRFELEVLRAIDLIKIRSEIKAVVERAFPEKCQASVVPDVEAALHQSLESGWRIYVTPDGDQVVNGRLIVTGAPTGQKETSLFALKREIKDLRTHVEGLHPLEAEIEAEMAGAHERLSAIERETTDLDNALREHEKAVAAGESNLEGLERDLSRAVQHVGVVEADIEQLSLERLDLQNRGEQLRPEIQAAEASRLEAEESLANAQVILTDLRAETSRLTEELSSARALAAARQERLSSARSEVRRIESEAEDLRIRINRNRVDLYESHTKVEQINASQAEAEAAKNQLEADVASLTEEIGGKTQSLTELRARLDELDQILTELRQTAGAAHERRSQIEVERARTESEALHLRKTCFSELAMSLEDVVTSVELAQAVGAGDSAEAGPPELASDAEGAIESALASPVFDVDAARSRLDELRIKLDELGPVNMMALEELEQSTERFKFLSEQRLDIINSIKGTEEALAEIKRRSRERFRHAFTHINQNFQRMFVELFGGGRGEMILIDEEDVLESGIDLIAQPPGKRLQNVLLLSGGEKAMAAISLVLAIFQYRPSPFCILDEVDAPLDEMNVGRFADEITRMSQETQFLVITHNKRTMESARALYGVTMEELGVSKLVSVRFE